MPLEHLVLIEVESLKPFHETPMYALDPHSLQEELDSKGYALIRDALPRADVRSVLGDIASVLSAAGWLLPGHDPIERIANASVACGDPDPLFKRTYHEVFNLELFHALPHHPALKRVMKMLAGEQVLVHPKPIGRLIFPNCENLTVHAHQDYRFMSGDTECFTVWIPLHDCPAELGPLQILESSHHFGAINHQDEDLHVPEIPSGAVTKGEWVGGQINAGDVLIFHSLTVHAASPNLSNRLRVSLDCRFQDSRRAINPGNLAFAGESGKSWERTYSNWRSNDLKYYWKRLPLNFVPSIAEIEQLSKTEDSPSKRARYARILSQVS
ncbi:MAG: phytanoyl-CoA dioxygenase family protein [Terracidiphilus sp.]|jgi:ectoine hydroxylase-related dioxygenase (phytanoyl-CoA dioxygenase family)